MVLDKTPLGVLAKQNGMPQIYLQKHTSCDLKNSKSLTSTWPLKAITTTPQRTQDETDKMPTRCELSWWPPTTATMCDCVQGWCMRRPAHDWTDESNHARHHMLLNVLAFVLTQHLTRPNTYGDPFARNTTTRQTTPQLPAKLPQPPARPTCLTDKTCASQPYVAFGGNAHTHIHNIRISHEISTAILLRSTPKEKTKHANTPTTVLAHMLHAIAWSNTCRCCSALKWARSHGTPSTCNGNRLRLHRPRSQIRLTADTPT